LGWTKLIAGKRNYRNSINKSYPFPPQNWLGKSTPIPNFAAKFYGKGLSFERKFKKVKISIFRGGPLAFPTSHPPEESPLLPEERGSLHY
jgi:hypothetical protein